MVLRFQQFLLILLRKKIHYKKYNFDFEGIGWGRDFAPPAEKVSETPSGTRPAMQRNLALRPRESAIFVIS